VILLPKGATIISKEEGGKLEDAEKYCGSSEKAS
jgi:hypothetical protein